MNQTQVSVVQRIQVFTYTASSFTTSSNLTFESHPHIEELKILCCKFSIPTVQSKHLFTVGFIFINALFLTAYILVACYLYKSHQTRRSKISIKMKKATNKAVIVSKFRAIVLPNKRHTSYMAGNLSPYFSPVSSLSRRASVFFSGSYTSIRSIVHRPASPYQVGGNYTRQGRKSTRIRRDTTYTNNDIEITSNRTINLSVGDNRLDITSPSLSFKDFLKENQNVKFCSLKTCISSMH